MDRIKTRHKPYFSLSFLVSPFVPLGLVPFSCVLFFSHGGQSLWVKKCWGWGGDRQACGSWGGGRDKEKNQAKKEAPKKRQGRRKQRAAIKDERGKKKRTRAQPGRKGAAQPLDARQGRER